LRGLFSLLQAIASLYTAHARGESAAAIDIDGNGQPRSAIELGIFDSLLTKHWAIKYASEVSRRDDPCFS
jgi:chaperonin GroEL (HSP60 family)